MKHYKVYLEDSLHEAVKQSAGDVPVSAWFRSLAIASLMWKGKPCQTEAAVHSAVNDGGYRITKVSKPKHEPAMDLSICQHNMTKAACPRCSSRI